MPTSIRLRRSIAQALCLAGLAVGVPAIAPILAPEPAEARAGGSYGSSSSSSTRSSSSGYRSTGYNHGSSSRRYRSQGGTSGYRGFGDLLMSVILLIVVIGAGFWLVAGTKKTATKPQTRQWQKSATELTGEMAKRDPVWQEANLLEQAREAYMAVQRAWVQRNQAIAKSHMTPAFYQRQKIQTDAMLARGERNVLENLAITNARIVHAMDFLDDSKDEVWVKFSARAVDYLINEQSGRVLKGKQGEISHFTEIWKFRRENDTWVVAEIEANAHAHVPDSFCEAVYG